MFRYLMLYIVIISWSSSLYALHLNQTKIYLAGHGCLSKPTIQIDQDAPISITNHNALGGGIFSIQPFERIGFDVTCSYSAYWITPENKPITPNGTIHDGEGYKTSLIDATLKIFLYHFTSHVRMYAKGGIWGLHSLHTVKRKKIGEEINRSSIWGYGVIIGPGINWVFAPRTYSSFSIDFAILCYFPPGDLSFLPRNYVKNKFPLGRLSLTWHAW